MKGLAALAVACAAVALAACGDTTTSPSAGVSGRFVLTSLNGAALPFTTYAVQDTNVVLTADTLTLHSDGTYSDRSFYLLNFAQSVSTDSLVELGTYSSTSSQVTFNDQTDGVQYTGALNGSTLTETSTNFVQVYEKR